MPLDDVELEGQPLAIVLARAAGRGAMRRRDALEPAPRCARSSSASSAAVVAVADREARQDRLARLRPEGAALARSRRVEASASGRSANSAAISARVLNRCSGVSWRRSVSARHAAFGDADQRVMRLVIVAARQRTARWSRPAAGRAR